MRRGWTLAEMLISLVLTGAIFALAAQHALAQLRFFEGVASVASVRGQVGDASGILARALRGVSPGSGDVVSALDSAIEFHAQTGTAVTCGSSPGLLVIPAARQRRQTLAAFWDLPDAGDLAHVYFSDSTGAGWLTLHVIAPASSGPACANFGEVAPGWLVQLREPIAIPTGAVVRFARPVRFSLYRAGDTRWYLGSRDWNGTADRFNTIQPVAGPLRPHSPLAESSGLRFQYFGADGTELLPPIDAQRIVAIRVTTRGETARGVRIAGRSGYGRASADSSVAFIALRNAQ